jgi:hypothetical protein
MNEDKTITTMLVVTMTLLALGFMLATVANQSGQLKQKTETISILEFQSNASYEIAMTMMGLLEACNADDGDGLSPKAER